MFQVYLLAINLLRAFPPLTWKFHRMAVDGMMGCRDVIKGATYIQKSETKYSVATFL